ncbi:MAG: hypothetical protein R2824_30960 [Saprospiraceae bacterium]
MYKTDNLPETQLRFGSGGGFTGMITEYTLLKNGQLFVRTGRAGSGDWEEYGNVKKADAKALFEYWEEHQALRDEVKQPGNMYRFLTMQTDSTEYRQSWGAGGYTPSEPMTTLYERAMALVKQVETNHNEKQ